VHEEQKHDRRGRGHVEDQFITNSDQHKFLRRGGG
jgi:hypothetical protein